VAKEQNRSESNFHTIYSISKQNKKHTIQERAERYFHTI